MRAWLIIGALLAIGCGSDPAEEGPGGSGGIGGTAGAEGGTGGTGAGGGGVGGEAGGIGGIPADEVDTGWTPSPPAALDGPMTELPRPASCGEEFGFFSSVRGWAVAPGGKPLPGAKTQLCVYTSTGGYVCLSPADADSEGVYTVDLPEDVRCLDSIAARVILPRSNRATSYCMIDREAGPAVRLYEPSVLPFVTPAADLPPEGDETAPRDVTFDDGLVLEVTPTLYYSGTGSYELFSGRPVAPDSVGLCGEASSFDGLYAFYPEGKISAPGFGVRIPNTLDFTAGAAVELFVLGGLDCTLFDDTKVPEAEWAKFGEGIVSEDGTTIVSADNAGLPCFTWLAYRLKE